MYDVYDDNNNIKSRLRVLGKKQVDLIKPIRAKGFKIDPSRLSQALQGHYDSPAYRKIVETAYDIVAMWERQREELA
ncbi:MAG: hypothetical protein FWH07_04485 [Oscillospiraceae bacterium]|nr:hypothetical protein [Oscillospiraceae bacterium]